MGKEIPNMDTLTMVTVEGNHIETTQDGQFLKVHWSLDMEE